MSDKPGKEFNWETVSVESFTDDAFHPEEKSNASRSKTNKKSSVQFAVRNWHLGPGNYRVLFQTKPGKKWRGNC